MVVSSVVVIMESVRRYSWSGVMFLLLVVVDVDDDGGRIDSEVNIVEL
jgi:hypothetical protein